MLAGLGLQRSLDELTPLRFPFGACLAADDLKTGAAVGAVSLVPPGVVERIHRALEPEGYISTAGAFAGWLSAEGFYTRLNCRFCRIAAGRERN